MADLWSSSRLIYRGVDPEDDDFLAQINAESEAFANMSPTIPVPRNKKTSTEFREFLTSPQQIMSAIICLPAEEIDGEKDEDGKTKEPPKPKAIGMFHMTGGPPSMSHHRHCELGLALLKPYRGQGYGTEVIKYCLQWGFKRANLHRIGIGAFSWNPGAVKLYKKLGFVVDARRRDFFWHDGKYWDCIEMAMLEGEWRERYGKEGGG